MIEVNLLPDSILQARNQRQIKRMAQLGFTAFLVVIGGLVLLSFAYLQLRTAQLNAARDKSVELEARVNADDKLAARNKAVAVQQAVAAVGALTTGQRSTDQLLRDLSKFTPRSIQIETLAFDTDNRLLIEGRAASYPAVSNFYNILKTGSERGSSPSLLDFKPTGSPFTDVKLSGTNQAGVTEVTFSIHTNYTQVQKATAAPTTPTTDQSQTTPTGTESTDDTLDQIEAEQP